MPEAGEAPSQPTSISRGEQPKLAVKAETIKPPPKANYLPEDFIDKAPVDQGPDVLMEWLDQSKNLRDPIKDEVFDYDMKRPVYPKVPMMTIEDQPPLESLDPVLRAGMERLLEDKAKMIAQLVWDYADVTNNVVGYGDSESSEWRKSHKKRIKEKDLGGRVRSLEEWKAAQLRLAMSMRAMGLYEEVKIIRYLFEQASAFSDAPAAGNVIEGKVIKAPAK